MKHIDECGMYYYICDGKEIIAEAFYGDDAQDIVDLLNEQEETIQRLKEIREEQIQTILKQKREIKALEKEVLDLRAEVGRLNSKKEVEIPHWLKYESSKGYTKKVNQDIRFDGDVDD